MGGIDGVGGATAPQPNWGRAPASGGGSAVPEGPAPTARPVSAGAAGGVVLEAMLALQAATGPEDPTRRALRRGHELLRVLGRLQAALLGRQLGQADLEALDSLCGQDEMTADPALAAILGSIRLRARVELARFGR
ncbi:MAG: flagellar assembly protein FliX [Rhodospirillales bacterium]|nr:flagellar assembly protein FliX [Rhodospirillales bacterium]